ncbi:hypothetical protein CTA1_7322 [Colletotrichum tanaceti]|uniref:Uncharacterized protein n=1 Tax=Colletotrichum tanaceti TaxID=1306861 RepID=A0A4U6X0E5_9PEZI|nr:hypothetical protein CTA1_7322 [Colletotrichum tanaceti]
MAGLRELDGSRVSPRTFAMPGWAGSSRGVIPEDPDLLDACCSLHVRTRSNWLDLGRLSSAALRSSISSIVSSQSLASRACFSASAALINIDRRRAVISRASTQSPSDFFSARITPMPDMSATTENPSPQSPRAAELANSNLVPRSDLAPRDTSATSSSPSSTIFLASSGVRFLHSIHPSAPLSLRILIPRLWRHSKSTSNNLSRREICMVNTHRTAEARHHGSRPNRSQMPPVDLCCSRTTFSGSPKLCVSNRTTSIVLIVSQPGRTTVRWVSLAIFGCKSKGPAWRLMPTWFSDGSSSLLRQNNGLSTTSAIPESNMLNSIGIRRSGRSRRRFWSSFILNGARSAGNRKREANRLD